jgi:molecular chaperone DnaJ
MYDQHGHAAFEHGMGGGNAGPGFGGADMGDIFGDIFGNIFGGGARQQGPRRGADIGYVMELDLEEAVAGVEKRIEIPTLANCEPCKGSGSADGKVETCATCHGRGQVRMQRGPFAMQAPCPHCAGTGKTIPQPVPPVRWKWAHRGRESAVGEDPGRRGQRRPHPPGGRGRGRARPARLRAICTWKCGVRPHAIFARDGDDLHCEVPIRISQAALGDSVRVPTLGGEVELRIPVETQTGKVFRLRDRGVKSVRSRHPGDPVLQGRGRDSGQPHQRAARVAGAVRGDVYRRERAPAFAEIQYLPRWREGFLGPHGVLNHAHRRKK